MRITNQGMRELSIEEFKTAVFEIDTDCLENYLRSLKTYNLNNREPTKQKMIEEELEARCMGDLSWVEKFSEAWNMMRKGFVSEQEGKKKTWH